MKKRNLQKQINYDKVESKSNLFLPLLRANFLKTISQDAQLTDMVLTNTQIGPSQKQKSHFSPTHN